ncbi:MAG: glutamyl-tRNA reductase [Gammaproteobacteria bacterium RIFCSPLOWO2_02_FULL_42_14]|nr:MAG: glutamyl-tRNA reductase [Gammaproteobacteria bacterium RIFCSPHIGHO2_02_FULL_42_43]OGT51621.1 MAG: glutamyl-tRNA reductase [Gammaproteobacteria bacterium RIFCSPHIGHO2_12_FULL_41_25]OGT62321.1 MAG: glutamyl-tRNA reductase [Gammaproteobacteria bacterium RIFCSPLOWO2_02_FULL_42_14]OGT85995.1 MAG: glutamyl-tRNA reductase [Gammaproteobacteria bacterium RIFCSPLOWO2_12_FULL_42_18]
MVLLVYGVNHQTAPAQFREKLFFAEEQWADSLRHLMQTTDIAEAVLLSTCHRTEIYATANNACALAQWLALQKNLSPRELSTHAYIYREKEAVVHAMRVASGMDSMILGEPQIAGQIKKAYFTAEKVGAVGEQLSQLFPAVFSASKHVRTHTAIAAHPVTLAYAVLQQIKQCEKSLENSRVLLIGAGSIIELMATHLHEHGAKKIMIANRTIEKTQSLATRLQAHAIRLEDIPVYLKETDIVISATASPLPIIGKGMIESALAPNRNLLLMDLAMPRDIEPEVATLKHVMLYHLDDLKKIIQDNVHHRQSAAVQAENILESHALQFLQKMRVFHVRHVIAKYREQLETICAGEYEKALKKLSRGELPEVVLKKFGQQLVNKMLHHPTVKLREAASEEQCEMFQSFL